MKIWLWSLRGNFLKRQYYSLTGTLSASLSAFHLLCHFLSSHITHPIWSLQQENGIRVGLGSHFYFAVDKIKINKSDLVESLRRQIVVMRRDSDWLLTTLPLPLRTQPPVSFPLFPEWSYGTSERRQDSVYTKVLSLPQLSEDSGDEVFIWWQALHFGSSVYSLGYLRVK